ncbi:MAG: hypothetical protein CL927_13265 [Deltaproteobacteria bacterium]|nr:hypothetical protein [Deltaproteobacteria bacterium]HCH64904.1 hypothetical protein [Deltaproteobacteria bacterium]
MFTIDMIRACFRLLVGVLLCWGATSLPLEARAQTSIPPELQPWVPWVLEGHPNHGCILTASDTPCVWPGRIDIVAGTASGRFTMRSRVDRATWVTIPGGAGQWPVDVWSQLGPSTVADRNGRPAIWLEAGTHTVSGRIDWEARPQSLFLPSSVGLVGLSVDGQAVNQPRLDADGRLSLAVSGDRQAAEGDAIELDVTRHITDGVPVRIRTRLALRVAGSARELSLGEILLPGTMPVAIDSMLPVRIGDGQPTVSAQVRPGNWTITIDAIAEGPVTQLTAPQVTVSSWPDAEFWSVATNEAVRSLTLEGGVGVEPGRTPIPPEHHIHPAYILQQGDTLTFEEMRRGVPAPPPSDLSVERSIWVDSSGEGLTTQDRIVGKMQDEWRLNVSAPMVLGHVSVDGTDRVITTQSDGTGVEVRSSSLSVVGESRLPSPWTPLPAVGWALDAQSLSTTIHTAPGWTLLAVSGADKVRGTALSGWSVVDIFFVLVLVGAIARFFGIRTAALAAVALGLSIQDDTAPGVLWLAAAIASAADDQIRSRKSMSSTAQKASRVAAIVLGAMLALQLAQYVSTDLPSRIWPSLTPDAGADTFNAMEYEPQESAVRKPVRSAPDRAMQVKEAPSAQEGGRSKRKLAKQNLYQTLQVDPAAVVQTGPGIPEWTGRTARLTWSGRVAPDHTIQLFLLPPLATRIGALLKAILLLWLAWRVVRLDRFWHTHGRKWWKQGLPLIALFSLATVAAPNVGHATPSAELLTELETRLTTPSECADACTSVSRARVTVRDLGMDRLPRIRIEAEVHAVETASWALPGPLASWRPASVRLDAYETIDTRRASDGFLHVRVPAGVHSVVMEGTLTSSDGMTLQFAHAPRAIRFDGPGFRMAGARRDGTVDDTLQITRIQGAGSGAVSRSSDNLAPWVTVERNLDLGIPWRVTTVVRRHGSPTSPLTLEVPLLPGEALTDASYEVRDGKVLAAFDGNDASVRWTGTLALSEQLRLEAPRDVSWNEQWSLACSPIFTCATNTSPGLAPVSHVVNGKWQPTWQPWPGETLEVSIARPESIPGQTVTIDALSLTTTPLARETESVLELSMRTSQGGQHPITLSPDATLLSLEVDGATVASRMRDGILDVPLQPGAHRVRARWSEPQPVGLLSSVSSVDPGAPAVNTTLTLDLTGTNADWRWVVWSEGRQYGTKALHVFCVAGWMMVAWVLGRFLGPKRTGAPFPTSTWVVLLLGMSTLPVLAVLPVLAWLAAVIIRSKRMPTHWAAYNILQLALLMGIPIVGIILFATIGMNLLNRPPLWFEGPGDGTLGQMVWSIDRLDGALPRPGVVSLPGWAWRGLTLAWCLGLVVAIAGRARWFWSALGNGGWLRRAPSGPPTPPAGPAPAGGAPTGSTGAAKPPREELPPGEIPIKAHTASDSETSSTPAATGTDPAFEETVIMASEFPDPDSDELELDSGEIEAGEEDGWVYGDSSSFNENPLPDGQTQATFGGIAGVSVLGVHRKPARSVPAVDLPYNPDRHVEIGPPAHDPDAIFVPAIDANPADYEAGPRRSLDSVHDQEE